MESVFPFLMIALVIALVLGTLRAIRLNLMQRPADQIRLGVISLLSKAQTFLVSLTAIALALAVPHPETILLLIVLTMSIMIDRWLQFREDSMSLNRWIRLGAKSKTPLWLIISGFSIGCRSLVGARAKTFAYRLMTGQPILESARRSKVPIDADNFATLFGTAISKEQAAAVISSSASDGSNKEFDNLDRAEQRRSRLNSASMEKFVYATVMIVFGSFFGLIQNLLEGLRNEFDVKIVSENSWYEFAEKTSGYYMLLVIAMLLWLVSAACIRWLPHPLVCCVPWFGARAIAQWRSTVLRWLEQQTEAQLPAPEAFLYSRYSSRIGWIRRRCRSAYNQLQKGNGLPVALHRSGLISKRERIWFTSAQQNGNLSHAIRNLIDDIDRQEANRWSWRSSWFLPVVTIIVGLHVMVCLAKFFEFLVGLLNSI